MKRFIIIDSVSWISDIPTSPDVYDKYIFPIISHFIFLNNRRLLLIAPCQSQLIFYSVQLKSMCIWNRNVYVQPGLWVVSKGNTKTSSLIVPLNFSHLYFYSLCNCHTLKTKISAKYSVLFTSKNQKMPIELVKNNFSQCRHSIKAINLIIVVAYMFLYRVIKLKVYQMKCLLDFQKQIHGFTEWEKFMRTLQKKFFHPIG